MVYYYDRDSDPCLYSFDSDIPVGIYPGLSIKIKLNIESLAIYKNIGGVFKMLYPFMTLNDNTEIVHSEILENSGKEEVEVRIEKPVQGGFYSATCWLPEYRWENIQGFSQEDIHYFQELLESVAHIILQLAREGGIEGGLDHAAGF